MRHKGCSEGIAILRVMNLGVEPGDYYKGALGLPYGRGAY